MIYLDNSATTWQHQEVTEKMLEAIKTFGNPSSLYRLAIEGEKLVDEARTEALRIISRKKGEVIFTSGGTEGDNWAIFSGSKKGGKARKKIITSQVEHPAVLRACERLEREGYEVVYIGVDRHCHLNLEELENELDDNVALVSLMAVNNETGSIFPINQIRKLMVEKSPKALLHADCVQALGKIDVSTMNAHIKTVSGHKIFGPKGVGCNFIEEGTSLEPFIVGGGQEKGQRSGTENVPGISGFGAACKIARENLRGNNDKMEKLKSLLLDGLKCEVKEIKINSPNDGISSILNISFLGTRGEVILHRLEDAGIYVSTGSACSSKKSIGSHVLRAMGLSEEEIEGTLRFSLNPYLTSEDMEKTVEHVKKAVTMFRRLGSFR